MPFPGAGSASPGANNSYGVIGAKWAATINRTFRATAHYMKTCNTNYQGEIAGMGDEVVISNDVIPSAFNVNAKMALPEPEDLTPTTTRLLINKGVGFRVGADDILKKQSGGKMSIEEFSKQITTSMQLKIDTEFFTTVPGLASSGNVGATAGASGFDLGAAGAPLVFNKANAVSIYYDMMMVLTERFKPEENRFVIFPAWAKPIFIQSELGQVFTTGDGTSPIRTGNVGMIDGNTNIYFSNNLPVTVDSGTGKQVWKVLFGHNSGITFASQMNSVDTYRNPNAFGMITDGLEVYGYQVVNSDAIGYALIAKA